MKSNYKKLGDYIRLIDERNKDDKVTRLLGVSIEKKFIESIANTVGTDMSVYKIVRKGQFAYGPVTSRNGDKVSIALLQEEECIISSSYTVFEIIDTSKLLPEYLNLWFKRPEFDRYARFHSHGSAREIFDWDEMCNVELPIPELDEQKKIVEAYSIIEKRIEIKRQINDNLESQALTLFHIKFQSRFDNLPDNWTKTTANAIFDVSIGKTPPREHIELFTSNPQDMLWVSISDIREQGMFIRSTKEYLTADAVKDYSVKIIPANTVIYSFKMTNGKTSITTQPTTTNEAIAHFVTFRKEIVPYTYFYLRSFKFSSFGSTSSITEAVNSKIIKNMDFILPTNTEIIDFNRIALPLMASIKSNLQEIVKLTDMQTTLLSILSH